MESGEYLGKGRLSRQQQSIENILLFATVHQLHGPGRVLRVNNAP
jgi:hypothetical protein